MTQVLMLTGIRRSSLSCVWIETGNPKQPLARVWIDREVRIALESEMAEPVSDLPLCA
ncbi:MAG TPA: hypothetical protein VKT75_01900 [Acidobacteriaceae bacterium]|nr:hypothetical protein [Acidobacteriaceae bacterium]